MKIVNLETFYAMPKPTLSSSQLAVVENVLLQAADVPGEYSGITYPLDVLADASPSIIERSNRGMLAGEPGAIVGGRVRNARNAEEAANHLITVELSAVSHVMTDVRVEPRGFVGTVTFINNALGKEAYDLWLQGKLFFGIRGLNEYGNTISEMLNKIATKATIATFDAHQIPDPTPSLEEWLETVTQENKPEEK